MNKVTVLCSCGTRLKSTGRKQHTATVWHGVARRARLLRKMGCSYAEIARQCGVNRQTLWLAMKAEGL